MEKNKYFVNRHGIRIVKCCSSCENKHYDRGNQRVCVHLGCLVRKNGLCKDWKMSACYDYAGIGDGRVKKKAYLDFVGKQRKEGITDIAVIRAEFEKENGSIYLNNK
jgi:hypothetical protein